MLAKEWAEDLLLVEDENSELLKESLMGSLNLSIDEGDEGSMDDGINTKLQVEWLEREKRINNLKKVKDTDAKADEE